MVSTAGGAATAVVMAWGVSATLLRVMAAVVRAAVRFGAIRLASAEGVASVVVVLKAARVAEQAVEGRALTAE